MSVDRDGDEPAGRPIRPLSDEHVHVPADYEAALAEDRAAMQIAPRPKRRKRR